MPPSSLILVGVLTPSVGILGTLLWPILQRRLRLTSLHVLILLIIAASIILCHRVVRTAWCTMGPVRASGDIRSQYISVLYGAFQSYARTLYAEIIPYDEEAWWHGLFCACLYAPVSSVH